MIVAFGSHRGAVETPDPRDHNRIPTTQSSALSDYENAVADTSHVRGRRSRAGDTDAAASQFGGMLAPAQAVIDGDERLAEKP
jgi:hypothetical protein